MWEQTCTPKMPKTMKKAQQMRTMFPMGLREVMRVSTTSFNPGARLITLKTHTRGMDGVQHKQILNHISLKLCRDFPGLRIQTHTRQMQIPQAAPTWVGVVCATAGGLGGCPGSCFHQCRPEKPVCPPETQTPINHLERSSWTGGRSVSQSRTPELQPGGAILELVDALEVLTSVKMVNSNS